MAKGSPQGDEKVEPALASAMRHAAPGDVLAILIELAAPLAAADVATYRGLGVHGAARGVRVMDAKLGAEAIARVSQLAGVRRLVLSRTVKVLAARRPSSRARMRVRAT